MSEELVADSLMNGILLDTGRAMPAAELGAISCPSDPPHPCEAQTSREA